MIRWNDPFFHLRCTGRTTRMAQEVLDTLRREGCNAVVVAPNWRATDRIVQTFVDLLTRDGQTFTLSAKPPVITLERQRIVFTTPEDRGIILDSMLPIAEFSKHKLFVDHSTLEQAYGKILAEWERYN